MRRAETTERWPRTRPSAPTHAPVDCLSVMSSSCTSGSFAQWYPTSPTMVTAFAHAHAHAHTGTATRDIEKRLREPHTPITITTTTQAPPPVLLERVAACVCGGKAQGCHALVACSRRGRACTRSQLWLRPGPARCTVAIVCMWCTRAGPRWHHHTAITRHATRTYQADEVECVQR